MRSEGLGSTFRAPARTAQLLDLRDTSGAGPVYSGAPRAARTGEIRNSVSEYCSPNLARARPLCCAPGFCRLSKVKATPCLSTTSTIWRHLFSWLPGWWAARKNPSWLALFDSAIIANDHPKPAASIFPNCSGSCRMRFQSSSDRASART
jgi:hypothetical protein